MALTFDAGASGEPGNDILAALRERGIKCTFFLTGKFVQQQPELVRAIVADGHELGNHTWSHRDLRTLDDEQIAEELQKTESEVVTLTGLSTKPYFRPPYGGRDKRVLKIASEQGYECVFWTADSWDAFKKGITGQEIKKRVMERVKPGAVILCHVGSRPTADVLPELLDELIGAGYDPVLVSELEAPVPR